MFLPRRLPPMEGAEALGEWLNHLRDYVASLAPQPSKGTRTGHSMIGVTREGLGKVEESEGGTSEPVWL